MGDGINLRVGIKPVPWQRPRKRRGGFYTAQPQREFQDLIRKAFSIAYPDHEIWHGPVTMSIRVIMPRPKHKVWKRKAMPSYPHINIPDLDNLVKGIIDALQGLAFKDDKQVFEIYARKIVHAGGEGPGVIIQMEEHNHAELLGL